MQRYAYPRIGARPVDEITTADLVHVLLPIWHTKRETARKVKTRMGIVMRYTIVEGHRSDDPAGPALAAALPRHNGIPPKHLASLPHGELAAALARLSATHPWRPKMACLLFIAATVARSGEARLATWDEIDLDAKTWTVSAERTKTSRMHVVPLSSVALASLEAVRPDGGEPSGLIYELGVTKGASAAAGAEEGKAPLDFNYEPHGTVTRGQMAAFITRALAHTSARPAGVSAQYAGSDVVVSVRDDDFQPRPNVDVDLFKTDTGGVDLAFGADGTCGEVVTVAGSGALCEIDGADPITGGYLHGSEVLADTLLHVTAPHASLPYHHGRRCPGGRRPRDRLYCFEFPAAPPICSGTPSHGALALGAPSPGPHSEQQRHQNPSSDVDHGQHHPPQRLAGNRDDGCHYEPADRDHRGAVLAASHQIDRLHEGLLLHVAAMLRVSHEVVDDGRSRVDVELVQQVWRRQRTRVVLAVRDPVNFLLVRLRRKIGHQARRGDEQASSATRIESPTCCHACAATTS